MSPLLGEFTPKSIEVTRRPHPGLLVDGNPAGGDIALVQHPPRPCQPLVATLQVSDGRGDLPRELLFELGHEAFPKLPNCQQGGLQVALGRRLGCPSPLDGDPLLRHKLLIG